MHISKFSYTPIGEDLILKLDGQTYRCGCGANVFKRVAENEAVRLCNGCHAVYIITDQNP